MSRPPASAAPPAAAATSRFDPVDAGLYGALIVVWGTSWIAIHYQLGVVDPAVSLFWRFVLSTVICFAIALARREQLTFPAKAHALFAAAGVLMFSTNFLFFYLAGRHVPTGLLAVVFALASPVNLGLAALFFGRAVELRMILGAAIGIAGVALLYAPEIAGTGLDMQAAGGLALALCGTLFFCLGNMVSAATQKNGVADVAAAAWGMFYGALWLGLLSLVTGSPFVFEWREGYVLSLLWLSIGSSVIAFLCYLALIKRIGPGRAGFATVLFPVVALAISSVIEDYRWTAIGALGLALVAVGNVVVLGMTHRRA